MSRPIRVLIAKPGLDGHDVGAKLVCRSLMAAGMEVVYTGLRQSPRAIIKAALEESVDVLGLSILSGAHLPLCSKVASEMKAQGLGEVIWLVGGNIPRQDQGALEALGVTGIFPTGSPFGQIVDFIQRGVGR
jgi:methylmalonyl-CoA mutase C-terminal domain/subunit